MEVPAFNPNAPGVILLGQIILDYNNHPTSQTGNQQSDNSEQSQSDEARSASDQMNGGQFNPADFIPPPNCASPKVYYSGPCSYGIPPPGVAQVPPQFVIPQGKSCFMMTYQPFRAQLYNSLLQAHRLTYDLETTFQFLCILNTIKLLIYLMEFRHCSLLVVVSLMDLAPRFLNNNRPRFIPTNIAILHACHQR